MPCGLKERFLRVPSFLPEFFVLISPFVQGSQSVLRINVSTQTRRMQEMLGLLWEMLRFSCMSFLHKMRDSFFAHQKGLCFSFIQKHGAYWTLLASLTHWKPCKRIPHCRTRLLCIRCASGQIRLSPPGCGSKEFFAG